MHGKSHGSPTWGKDSWDSKGPQENGKIKKQGFILTVALTFSHDLQKPTHAKDDTCNREYMNVSNYPMSTNCGFRGSSCVHGHEFLLKVNDQLFERKCVVYQCSLLVSMQEKKGRYKLMIIHSKASIPPPSDSHFYGKLARMQSTKR